jgi:energy-coupling factor transport system permease protein
MRIRDITLGQYAPRESIVHGLDPRTKVLSSLFFMTLLLFIHRLELLFVFFAVVLVLFRLSKLDFGLALRNLRPFLWLFLITFILHVMFTKGRILWKVPAVSLYITEEGITRGLFYTFRIGILVMLASLLTLTTSPMSLTDAIERFLSPFRFIGVPAHEIAMMLSISLRFIPILIDEAERIRKAQISRGSRFVGSIVSKIRSVVPLIIPLFLSTFRRANDLALAMDARCYQGGGKRTSYHVLRFGRNDMMALLAVLFFGFPVFLLR